jgi:TonB family protein
MSRKARTLLPGPVPLGAALLAPALLASALLLAGCLGGADLERPVLLQGEEPIEYPLELWDEGVEGELLLRVRVSAEGQVDSVEVSESSGSPALDSAAVRGARELRFEPGRKGGRLVPMWATLPVHFTKELPPAEPRP